MRISVAQTRPIKADIPANIEGHLRLLDLAAGIKADTVIFPELSLTGYEPELAQDLATDLMTLVSTSLKHSLTRTP